MARNRELAVWKKFHLFPQRWNTCRAPSLCFYFPSWQKRHEVFTLAEQIELWLQFHNLRGWFCLLLTVLSCSWQLQFGFSLGPQDDKLGCQACIPCRGSMGGACSPFGFLPLVCLWIWSPEQAKGERMGRPWGHVSVCGWLCWERGVTRIAWPRWHWRTEAGPT